jgi:hypothetical protein
MFWDITWESMVLSTDITTKMVNFENVQNAIQSDQYMLINTFPTDSPFCVIKGTVTYPDEERMINEMMNRADVPDKKIIIYGKNSCDLSVTKKYKQICSLGITAFIYSGGIFEWLMLQDIYGKTEFPTENWFSNNPKSIHMDILSYKPSKRNI